MQVTKEAESPTHFKLVISANDSELEPIKRHSLSHLKSNVKVPGFRAGSAPQAMVEKHIDQQKLIDEFLEHALNHFYRQAIASENIRPAGQPQIQVTKFVPFTDLEFSAEADAIGNFSLADYKNIKLPKKKITVVAGEVNAVLNDLVLRAAKRQAVTRAAKVGDEIVINFAGKDKSGKLINGAEAKDYPLLLGSGRFIPGFEEELIGLKPGNIKKFSLKFPADYSVASLRNKDVNFEIEVKKVNSLEKPKLDDKFAASLGPFKTIAELRKNIKQQLINEKQQQADRAYENELIQKIVDNSKAEIPESLISEELERSEAEEKRNLIQRGQTWMEHLEAEGITEEGHKKRHRPEAENRVKTGLILSEIIERENPEVKPEELELRIQILKAQHQDPAMQAELDKPENRREIEARLKTEKTIARFVEYSSGEKATSKEQ